MTDPKLLEAVARALWGPGTGKSHPSAIGSSGRHNWEYNVEDAVNVFTAISEAGFVLVKRKSGQPWDEESLAALGRALDRPSVAARPGGGE